jgi:plastocyanin
MRVPALALLIAATATPFSMANAQTTVSDAKPVTVVVRTPKHGFHPQVIRMKSGVPIRLVIENPSGTDHDFYAPEFFAGAQINDADRGIVQDGRVEIHKYDTRSVRLIARPGHYDLKSTKALDVASGMQGQILVY